MPHIFTQLSQRSQYLYLLLLLPVSHCHLGHNLGRNSQYHYTVALWALLKVVQQPYLAAGVVVGFMHYQQLGGPYGRQFCEHIEN